MADDAQAVPPDALRWVLLLYTVPSKPSRLRAAVWRDLKRAGAVYVRDGVCALPDVPHVLDVPGSRQAREALAEVGARVDALGGTATLVTGGELAPERARELVEALQAARDEEYAALEREADNLLAAIHRERTHRDLRGGGGAALTGDITKLRDWAVRIAARDYLANPRRMAALAAVERCALEASAAAVGVASERKVQRVRA